MFMGNFFIFVCNCDTSPSQNRAKQQKKSEDIRIDLDVSLAQYGRRTFFISQEDINLPPGVELTYLEPSTVRLEFKSKALPEIRK